MNEALVKTVSERLGLQALYCHGSRATGHSRPDSDFDFAYLAPHGSCPGPIENTLLPTLAKAFQCDESIVDLQNLRSAPPHFRVRVLHFGEPIYVGDGTELARFYTSSVSQDRDTQVFTRPFRAAMRRRLKDGTFAT